MTERRVVVTGIGTINPLGNNIAEFFSNLEKGVSGAAPITHFDAEKFKTKFACEVKNYDWTQHFDRKEVRKYDLFTQYALIAATQAVEDSGLDLEKEDLEQIGVIWSSGIGGLKTFFDECLGYAAGDGTPRFSPFFIPRMIADIAVKCFRKPFDIAMRQQKAGIMGSCQYGAGILGKKLFIGNIYAMLLQLFAHFLVAQIA